MSSYFTSSSVPDVRYQSGLLKCSERLLETGMLDGDVVLVDCIRVLVGLPEIECATGESVSK